MKSVPWLSVHANREAWRCNGEECRILLAASSPDDCTSCQKTCRDHKLVDADDDCFGLCCFLPLPWMIFWKKKSTIPDMSPYSNNIKVAETLDLLLPLSIYICIYVCICIKAHINLDSKFCGYSR